MIDHSLWEPVIGLEIHAQLNTKTKLFSPAPNRFGDEPNTNISYVCTGQPGSLPVLNEDALRKAIRFGLAVHSEIARYTTFDRKSYFYPDSPRNFQITQQEHPLLRKGTVITSLNNKRKEFAIHSAHIEDDAGMLKHFTNFTGIDYNRAGSALLEIVSEPCLHSPQEASAYAAAIRSILMYLDACDGNMEEGSLRMDVNVSVRLKTEKTFRPRIEIKNMNSFSFLEMAIAYEVHRQIDLYTRFPHQPPEQLIAPGTYRWDVPSKQTILMRKKESVDDYRYFPEPDLPPLILTEQYINSLRADLPELPYDRFQRYTTSLGLTPYSASLLTNEKYLSDYFEQANALCNNPRSLCNWITVEFAGRLSAHGKTFATIDIPPSHLAKLIRLIDSNQITGPIAKAVADEMISSPHLDPEIIVRNNPQYQPLNNTAEIEQIVDTVLSSNEQSVRDFQAGKEKAFAFLVGQVMKHSQGKAPPQLVNALLRKKIQEK